MNFLPALPPFARRVLHALVRCSPLLLAVLPTGALAQWSGVPGINNPIITDTSITPLEPLMVSDGAGGAAFLWRDGRAGVNDTNLYAQRLDANGARRWGDNGRAVCDLPGNIDAYGLIADGSGGFYAVWDDQRPVNSVATHDVYVQRLDADGASQWTGNGKLLRVNGAIGYTGLGDKLLGDGVGGVYVYAGANPNSVSDFASRVYRLKDDGQPPAGWTTTGVDLAQNSVTYLAAMLSDKPSDAAGEHGVLMLLNTQGGGLVARQVNADGTLGFSTPVYTYFGTYTFKSACTDGQGGAYIVTGINADLFCFHLKADGSFAWPENDRRVVLQGGWMSDVSLVPDGAGGAIVSWFGPAPGTSDYRMAVQRISATGERLWGDNGLNVHTPGGAYAGDAVSDGSGGVIVSWGLANPSQLRAQRFDGNGQKLWPADGILISEPWGLNQLVTDQASGAIYSVVSGSSFGAKRTTLTGTLGSNSPTARLANISARATVGSGNDVLIPGFVIAEGPMQLLIRGVGPGLTGLGVSGAIDDPQLTLYNAASAPLATNNDWGLAGNAAEIATVSSQVGAFALAAGSKDAALLATLQPGLYTAVMSSAVNGASGVGLVELYAVSGPQTTGRLVNMSVRAHVGTGDNVVIPGIVIGGTGARSLLIRAVGPTLAPMGVTGVLANPTMTLYSGTTAIGANDSWWSPNLTQVSTIGQQVGAFALPTSSADAALLVTLAPGVYTAHLSGVNATAGVCLMEVYEVP